MVRTAGTAIKTGGGKSTKGIAVSGGGGGGAGGGAGGGGNSRRKAAIGGNKVAERPIPKWQQPITSFFNGSAPPQTVPEFMPVTDSQNASDDEERVLEAPEWQKPVTIFLKPDKIEVEAASSKTVLEDKINSTILEDVEMNVSDDIHEEKDKENQIFVTERADDDVDPPAKRQRLDIDYRNLEEFEDC